MALPIITAQEEQSPITATLVSSSMDLTTVIDAYAPVPMWPKIELYSRLPCAKQRLFCDACAVNHQRTDDGGGQRSNGRALNAQRRTAAQAENQKRIERDIYSDGNQRADERDHHVAGALQQRAAAARERQKRIAERDDAQIGSAQRDGLLI